MNVSKALDKLICIRHLLNRSMLVFACMALNVFYYASFNFLQLEKLDPSGTEKGNCP